MSLYIIALAVVVIWLIVLTVVFVFNFSLLSKLGKEVKKKNFISILEDAIKKSDKNSEGIKELKKSFKFLDEDAENHIQKVGLVRYNPFAETGGDHSFTLSLLDNKLNGVLITGLHTRERTRIYIKDIQAGKSELELSKEEQNAIEKAK